MAKTNGQPDVLEFLPDLTSKKKKGVHKPIYAKVFTKDNERSTTVEIDFTAVSPMHGQRVVKRSTQINISTNVIEDGVGFTGN